MKTEVHKNYAEGSTDILCRISESDLMLKSFGDAVLHLAAKAIAERYVEEHYGEIVAGINQQAIAALAIAESGAAIRKTLAEKIPDKVLEVHSRSTEVWQRGMFGGLKRL